RQSLVETVFPSSSFRLKSGALSPGWSCTRKRVRRWFDGARLRRSDVVRAEGFEPGVEAGGGFAERRRESLPPVLARADTPAPIADREKTLGREQAVDREVRDRERVRRGRPRDLERLQRGLLRRGAQLPLREDVEIRLRDDAIGDERPVREGLGHAFGDPADADHAGVAADVVLPEVDVLVRGQLGPFGVGGPGIWRGRLRRRPCQVRRHALEAVADGETAIALRAVANVDMDDRRRTTRAAGERVEVRARVLHALVHEGDVRRGHARVDVEARAARVRGSGLGERAVGVEHEHLPEDADVLEPRRALDERPHVEAIGAGIGRRLHGELEPRDLTGADVRRRLLRDAVVARPRRGGRPQLAVAAEDARLVLPGLALPGPEVGDFAEAPRDPAERARVVVREGRRGHVARTEPHVAALAVPGGVESRKLRRRGRGRRDAWADIHHTACGRGRTRRGDRRDQQQCAEERTHHLLEQCRELVVTAPREPLRIAPAFGLGLVRPLELRERRARDPAGPVPHVAFGLPAWAIGPPAFLGHRERARRIDGPLVAMRPADADELDEGAVHRNGKLYVVQLYPGVETTNRLTVSRSVTERETGLEPAKPSAWEADALPTELLPRAIRNSTHLERPTVRSRTPAPSCVDGRSRSGRRTW